MGGMSPCLILERLGKHKTFFSSELFANNLNAPILFVPNFVHASKSQDVHYITGFNRKSHDPFMFLYDPERKGRIYFDDGVWRHDEHMKSS